MRLKDILSEAIKIQGKPDHWPGDDHIILVTTAPTKTYALKFNNKNDSYPNSIRFPNNMGTKPVDTNKAARELWLKIKADVVKWRSTNESVNESTEASEIIKDLDKVKTDLIKKVDVLIAKKKKLYSDVDITTPMSADEKKLDKDIQDIFSQIQQLIQQKRKIKTESINESSYDLGKVQYTDKKLTPTDILDLAMAYAQTPVTKIVGNKHEYRVRSANDLAKLNGTTQSDAKTRGKQPALILFLLKNELVSKEEYVKLYKVLLAKQIEVIRYLKNSSPEMRNSGGAMRAAEKDGRGEFGESD